jgi:hypothetical protein
MSTKKVKAVKMWRIPNNEGCFNPIYQKETTGGFTELVFVLPATPEAYEAMLKQMMKTVAPWAGYPWYREELSRAVLASLGVNPATKEKK